MIGDNSTITEFVQSTCRAGPQFAVLVPDDCVYRHARQALRRRVCCRLGAAESRQSITADPQYAVGVAINAAQSVLLHDGSERVIRAPSDMDQTSTGCCPYSAGSIVGYGLYAVIREAIL